MKKIIIILVSLLTLSSCLKNQLQKFSKIAGSGGGGYSGFYDGDISTSPPEFCPVIQSEIDSLSTDDLPFISNPGGRAWKSEWTKTIYGTLKTKQSDDLLRVKLKTSELKQIGCPNFNSMALEDKSKFWAIFMSSMAYAESGFQPRRFYGEKGTNDSYGLLQIDSPNSRNHGCLIDGGRPPKGRKKGKFGGGEMYDPHTNLICGARILRNQVTRYGSLFYANSYWAVLRRSRPGHYRMRKFLVKNIGQIKSCKGALSNRLGQQNLLANNFNSCGRVMDSSRGQDSSVGEEFLSKKVKSGEQR